jgi:signal transduction histidine kinase
MQKPVEDREGRTRFAFLAETSRCLADSLDLPTTLETAAGLALPHFGTWCMVDIVEPDTSITRVAVIHPDAEKQKLARDYYRSHPPARDDAIGAPRVIRTQHSEFSAAGDDALGAIGDAGHRDLLRQLGAQSYLIVPMRARGRTLGAITFVSDDLRRYDDADLLLAEDLGRRCAMAIDNARHYGQAENARRAAEVAREEATFAVQRANALRELAEDARREAEGANRTKATFLTTMSHEFRTPLGAILGYVGLLNENLAGPLTDVQRNYVRRIGNASGSLLRLIEEVLTLSQVQAGHGRVTLEDVDVSALVRDVAELLEPLIGARQLHLGLDLPDEPIHFATDAGKLRQVMINLAANAVKFTSEGEVRLGLREVPDGIVLTVKDTGEGLSASDIEQLFEAFVQVGPTNNRQTRGTGLGLSITRQLVRLLHGEVTVESAPGHGSTFTVHLPDPASTTGREDSRDVALDLRERRASGRASGRAGEQGAQA